MTDSTNLRNINDIPVTENMNKPEEMTEMTNARTPENIPEMKDGKEPDGMPEMNNNKEHNGMSEMNDSKEHNGMSEMKNDKEFHGMPEMKDGKVPDGMSEMNGGKMPHGKPPVKKGTMGRLLKYLFKFYPVAMPLTIFSILFASVATAVPDIMIQKVVALITKWEPTGDWTGAVKELTPLLLFLVGMYIVALLAVAFYNQMMAIITQGFLYKLRKKMFDRMQDLPIRYFDTHKHGDIMSYYTNDIDMIRQLVSQSLPTILRAGVVVLSAFGIMLWYSAWMALVVLVGTVFMFVVSKKGGGGSAKYFIKQQKSVAKMEGYVQEIMAGQKVVKVFNHEAASQADFDKLNEELYENGKRAHTYANILAPIIMNIGNILYVIVAVVGGVLLLSGVKNISLSGMAFEISIIVTFLNTTKQFTGNVNQVSQQINSIVMGMAGTDRIFELMDQKPEKDYGTVTLVNVNVGPGPEHVVTESEKPTGKWAWRRALPDGGVEYTRLMGDIRMNSVDFGYRPDHTILHDISLYAKPGQKVAFVGATGAGKTTITNLLNRFYYIQGGKISYDGIDINEINKQHLRQSLGIVLQDVNLFTGTVMENIRYGKLDATDEECIEAAKLANADGFIRMLPDGYNTVLSGDGGGLSQGQRQLISIARAAVANPPVMILDEATSSIDTRTEAIVQRGMDKLMEGRTVFVIAHRLSTVRDANVIMVLEKGVIIERGTHEQLLEMKGKYYQLYTGAFELE